MNKESLGYKVFRFTDHISIGRGGNNDIVLMGRDDVKVSRNHANVQKTKRRGVKKTSVFISGQKGGVTPTIRKELRRQNTRHSNEMNLALYG